MPCGGEVSSCEIKWEKQKGLPVRPMLPPSWKPRRRNRQAPFLSLPSPAPALSLGCRMPECQTRARTRHCRCGGQRCGNFGAGAEGTYLCQSAQGQVPVELGPPPPRRGLCQDHGVFPPLRSKGVTSREPEQRGGLG